MNTKNWTLTLWLALLSGCQPAGPGGPPNVRYGEEACANCRMIISDERFASALVGPDGEALKFDDVGCMVLREAEAGQPVASRWVRSFSRPGWLDTRDATFVYSREIASPMGHGLAAVDQAEAAAALEKGPGARRLRFEELADFVRTRQDPPSAPQVGSTLPQVTESSSGQESIR